MSEFVRAAMTEAQWQITKGHIRASVSLRGNRRVTELPTDNETDRRHHNEWLRFARAADDFIALVENEGWSE